MTDQSAALFRTLTRIFLATCRGATLKADLLAMAGSRGETFGGNGLWGADVGFDSDFFGHGRLRVGKKA